MPARLRAVAEGGRRRRRSLGEGVSFLVWFVGWGLVVGGLQGGVEGVGHGVFFFDGGLRGRICNVFLSDGESVLRFFWLMSRVVV